MVALPKRPGSQVVRQGTANPLYEGSIPSGASKSFAGVVKLADTLALGASAERTWEFKSPPRHQKIKKGGYGLVAEWSPEK